ncbi:PEP-CTERM sorting domain-containing protein [Ruficoccus sp. ZRK36]|uniref:PEP-CTERM sorting domain-containing protein n=1 Tax=Ruficoccus sp. ZRK36 TaxID=2866311 RepID=UPI001C73A585|nr:PEP-CTERM sorting domain-containing protein [Ruficoccus sp. ZRK36]QYY37280.1 PEP-CTERM sorting domain-containing protein [Ruficoccus sp. ZRK36]
MFPITKKSIALLIATIAAPLLPAQTVLLDVGYWWNATSGQPQTWNNVPNITFADDTELVANMVDTSGTPTGIKLTMTNAAIAATSSGSESSTLYPSTATADTYYDSTSGDAKIEFEFSNLDTDKTYSFTIYASRTGLSTNRSALYTITGSNTGSGSLNPTENVNNTITISGITPTEGGIITLTAVPDASNADPQKVFYIGVMEITASVPESSSTGLVLALGALSFILFKRRKALQARR